ncbi:hypothetical protein KUH03_09590 [Sphingobacterium sp. E70]|uniref:metallophosphoesterase N-terminal domain-containing protein n=1 Tax=Sphingobacterium sp. E70 TaxID=2853439 RepID=UPI00211D1485|nr:metallophosphoesterase N-terminal domain-containing protein [Sphingobacterium sp. E70]ULT27029.1 hypothetical protein KUH03_09590 [Sphingobacterium sp. E70]
MKTFMALTISLALAQTVQAQEFAKGKVFLDVNRNGKLDKNEKGIPSVSVSNGREVVATDKEGNYKLPVGNDNIIFVVKPSGYAVPVDENNHPKFYYIHKVNGSPASKYPGVTATGKIPASVNFALYQQEEQANFSAFVFGDPQAYTEEELGFLRMASSTRLRTNLSLNSESVSEIWSVMICLFSQNTSRSFLRWDYLGIMSWEITT